MDAPMMEFLMSDMVYITSVVQKQKCMENTQGKVHREQTVHSCVHSNRVLWCRASLLSTGQTSAFT